jgi:hypothetical protein
MKTIICPLCGEEHYIPDPEHYPAMWFCPTCDIFLKITKSGHVTVCHDM